MHKTMRTITTTPAAANLMTGRELSDKRAEADRAARALNGDRVDTTTPLAAPSERQANITIEVAPDGLHIRAEYTGTLASIPAAIERLKAAGVLELVQASAVAPRQNAPVAAPAAGVVDPWYNPAGEACCPVHRKALQDGARGLFCSAKAKDGQVADKKGYCGLKFND